MRVRCHTIIYMVMLVGQGHAANVQQEEVPPMEFLEFLGEGITVEDEIIDPVSYGDIEKMTGSDKQPAGKHAKDE